MIISNLSNLRLLMNSNDCTCADGRARPQEYVGDFWQ